MAGTVISQAGSGQRAVRDLRACLRFVNVSLRSPRRASLSSGERFFSLRFFGAPVLDSIASISNIIPNDARNAGHTGVATRRGCRRRGEMKGSEEMRDK